MVMIMRDKVMTDYAYGYCGMPCALCTRYRTNGTSRCPGCSHDGYYTEPCKVHHCCREKQLNHCGSCESFPCIRLGKMGDFSDLNTNHVKNRTCVAVSQSGFDVWYMEYVERADLLTVALERYNNGRMKRYLCELFIQQDMDTLRRIMQQASTLSGDPREAGKAFKSIVESVIQPKEHIFRYVKTDGDNKDFISMCHKLDENLDEIVGVKSQRSKYAKYNNLDSIHDVIVIYQGDTIVGSGAYKFYDSETVEIKRVYIDKLCRGMGLGKKLLLHLEADAKEAGYRYAILETGAPLIAAMGLYKKLGYQVIPNYGQYQDMPESICMRKML